MHKHAQHCALHHVNTRLDLQNSAKIAGLVFDGVVQGKFAGLGSFRFWFCNESECATQSLLTGLVPAWAMALHA